MDLDIGLDEDDEITDIREQIFHNTVREQIVSFSLHMKSDNGANQKNINPSRLKNTNSSIKRENEQRKRKIII